MINAEVGVEKRETSYTDGGNVNYYSHCGEVWMFLQNEKQNYCMTQQFHA